MPHPSPRNLFFSLNDSDKEYASTLSSFYHRALAKKGAHHVGLVTQKINNDLQYSHELLAKEMLIRAFFAPGEVSEEEIAQLEDILGQYDALVGKEQVVSKHNKQCENLENIIEASSGAILIAASFYQLYQSAPFVALGLMCFSASIFASTTTPNGQEFPGLFLFACLLQGVGGLTSSPLFSLLRSVRLMNQLLPKGHFSPTTIDSSKAHAELIAMLRRIKSIKDDTSSNTEVPEGLNLEEITKDSRERLSALSKALSEIVPDVVTTQEATQFARVMS